MAAYQFFDPAPAFLNLASTAIAAGGSLTFYQQGTTTLMDTYSDSGLTTANTNPVALDSAGRSETNIWLSGDYTVVLKDASGNEVWSRDMLSSTASSSDLPTLVTGEFLTNDGTTAKWASILQVPDPTDLTDYKLKSDGTQAYWAEDADTTADVDVSTTTTRVVTNLDQWGTATLSAGSATTTTTTITYPIEYDSAAYDVQVTLRTPGANSTGYNAIPTVINITKSTFQVQIDTNTGHNITNALTIGWRAIGPYTATN